MFHGWRIVAVGALGQGVSAGATFYSFGVLLKPLAAEFEISRLVTTLSFSLLMLVQGLVSPFIGRALDQRSVRGIMSLGVCVLALGLLLLSFAQSFGQVVLAFGFMMAIGAHMFGPVSAATLVSHWFVARRGRALGITSLGATLGGFCFPPLVTYLVAFHGWRGASQALAFGVLLLLIPFWFLVVNRPEDRGLHPDGAEQAPDDESEGSAEVVDTRSLLRSRNLWVITATMGLAFAPAAVLLAHLYPYATDLGVSPGRAGALMSVYAFFSGFGRVGVGAASDHIDKRLAVIGVMFVLSIGWFSMLGTPTYTRLLVSSAVMGFAVGGVMPLWGALTGACFGREVFGRAMGLMNLPMLIFNLSGAPIAAYLYDRSGGYGEVLGIFLIPMAASAIVVCFLRVPPPRHSPS